MGNKIDKGGQFPDIELSIVGGDKLSIPGDIATPYALVLFYRGHWWPFCRRQFVGFEQQREALAELGVSIIAGSVDAEEKLSEISTDIGFPVAWGMTREMGDKVGAWWDEERNFIQPSDFFMTDTGKVLASSYASSPIGRMEPEDVLMLAKFIIWLLYTSDAADE